MEEYKKWLQDSKNLSYKVAMDNASRIKRAMAILCVENIGVDSIESLEKNEEFRSLSVSVKSQIRRAIRLYIEYQKEVA